MYQSLVKERKQTFFEPSFQVLFRLIYIAARWAIEQFVIPEQVVFNLLLYEV